MVAACREHGASMSFDQAFNNVKSKKAIWKSQEEIMMTLERLLPKYNGDEKQSLSNFLY